TSFYRTQARSLFLFSYLLHFNCKFVCQKAAGLRLPFWSLVMRQTDDRADNDKALIASET
ncbi:hypothetical protein, partial [Lacticaseibacillus paracasei]|uniref:hypothetical protein n=1 Tax=Lacticaseibacillus paracasei TaxID=1597 RepID=UPI001EE7D918